VLLVASVPIAVMNSYLGALTIAAWWNQRRHRDRQTPDAERRHRIAVLVPAHDEESIIGAMIDSAVAQRSPRSSFEVHVVADNCSDATARVAREHGAHVHERVDPTAPGKGPALGWAVERILAEESPPDAFVIVDADTTICEGFLSVVDAALAGEGRAWQSYYAVREPELSPATALRQAALALRHYVRPLGRIALGGSSGLYGNGMVFRAELLRTRRFSAHLTEDVEFQLELLLEGERVGFLPDARIEAEIPTTLAGATTQNERWELGRLQLARRFVPVLARRTLLGGEPGRIANGDALLDQLVPPLSVLAAATMAVTTATSAGVVASRGRSGRAGVALAWLSVGALGFHVIAGLRVARAPRAVYGALLGAPRAVAWKVALWLRVLLRPRGVSWQRTERNRGPGPGGQPPVGGGSVAVEG
jgi:hypothetical protein